MPNRQWAQTDSKVGMYQDPETKKSFKTLLGKWKCPRCGIKSSWFPDTGKEFSRDCEHCYNISNQELSDIRNEQRLKEADESRADLNARMDAYDKKIAREEINKKQPRRLSIAS